jgi:serine protease Do
VVVAAAAVAKRMRRAVGLPDERGVLVVRVKRESAADTAGLARGDLVTQAGERPIRSVGDLDRAVRAANGTLTLKVLRGSEPHELSVDLNATAAAER